VVRDVIAFMTTLNDGYAETAGGAAAVRVAQKH
jgi:hypothetical protein